MRLEDANEEVVGLSFIQQGNTVSNTKGSTKGLLSSELIIKKEIFYRSDDLYIYKYALYTIINFAQASNKRYKMIIKRKIILLTT